MESLIIFVHIAAAVAIIVLVLIQHGKGADMGASFGSGASQTMFGSLGSGNFLTKSTSVMALAFFITSIGLAIIARQQAGMSVQSESLVGDIEQVSSQIQPRQDSDVPVVSPVENQDVPLASPGTENAAATDDLSVPEK
ncbi:MAG: preprotein translocase subunit SecG [Pseudomonadales bacterium]|nr:preprotein translocase subunit SecG [Pseudomonadales bacterium]